MKTVKLFIGSGEASIIERKVYVYSVLKHSSLPVSFNVFNGTHDSLEVDDNQPVRLNTNLKVKYKNITEFSNYRFDIPKLCDFKGKAIWTDSDMICLGDIAELWNTDLGDANFAAKADAYTHQDGQPRYGPSVMVIDNSKTEFQPDKYYNEIEQGDYSYQDLVQFSPNFLESHPFKINKLDPNWNSFDLANSDTKLIHFTNLYTQPWKFPGHPYSKLWFKYLKEAVDNGYVSKQDIFRAKSRAYVRQDLDTFKDFNPVGVKKAFNMFWKELKWKLSM